MRIYEKTTLKIDGMMCGMCESHVNDIIRKTFPVKKVTSSHVKGETVVISDDFIDGEQLKRAVESTGYRVSEIKTENYEKKGLFSFLKK